MKKTLYILLLVIVGAFGYELKAQGCSDAGFCTMGAMRPDQAFNKKIKIRLRSVEVSYYRGKTTLSPVIHVANLDATVGITNNLGLQFKIPYFRINGNFANTKGLGDISLSLTQRVINKEQYDVNLTLGAKIPTNNSNLKSEGNVRSETKGLELPMYYQTSLGSYDIVAGASLISSKWMFAAGIQMALTENGNEFKWGPYNEPVYPSFDYVKRYARATHLKRGTDVMIRVERSFRFSNYSFNFGVLPIYRITKDQRYGINEDGSVNYAEGRNEIDNTTGLALTLLGAFTYHVDVNHSLKLSGGKKVTDRDTNPDGLTRNNVMILAYSFRF